MHNFDGGKFDLLVECNLQFFFFQAEDGIRDYKVTGVQTCALPISWLWSNVLVVTLATPRFARPPPTPLPTRPGPLVLPPAPEPPTARLSENVLPLRAKIGRASCRERV